MRAWLLARADKCWHVAEPRVASAWQSKTASFLACVVPGLSSELHTRARPFKPAQRLRQKHEFDRVYKDKDARRFADGLFAIFARHNGSSHPRLGLSVAARIIGNSVRRNQVKRLVRESFRHHQHELPAVDIVVNARSGAREADNAIITQSLKKHWQAVIKKCAAQ